nr:hypothetical protein CDS [Bradyrhizobium sp.]
MKQVGLGLMQRAGARESTAEADFRRWPATTPAASRDLRLDSNVLVMF